MRPLALRVSRRRGLTDPDELASAAEIVTRKSAGTPVAIVRGAAEWAGDGNGRMLIRDPSRDLFR